MSVKPFLLFGMGFLVLVQPANDEKAKKDLDAMQGTWVMHALEINGKDVPPQQTQDTNLTIRKDDYKTTVKGKDQRGLRIKLDPSKDPKAMDMIQTQPDGSEKVIKGIYTIEKDLLKICRGLTSEQERPNQFATWPGTSYFVVTWKKQVK